MDNILPRDWTVSNIAQVVKDIRPGFACGEKNVEEGFPHLRMNNIGEDGDLVLKLLRKVPREIVKAQNILQKGDLLICTTNSSKLVGKVALFDLPGNYAFSNHLTRLRPNSTKILGEFFKWNLWLQWKSGVFDDKCKHWVNQSTIPKEVLREIEIILPPLSEQHRIVAKLEKLLAKVKACHERLNKIPTLLKRFRQSVLAAACSGRLSADWREQNSKVKPAERLGDGDPPSDFDLPSTWHWLLSAHAFGFVTSGSRGWARYYSDKGAIFLRVGNLNHDSIGLDLRSIQRVSPPVNAEGRRTKVIEGDILISITADVGMVALMEAGLEEAYINQHVALCRPVGNMDRRYLAYFLAAKNGGQAQFLNLQRGATKVGLGLDDIRRIWIARPPLPEQQEIVRRVKALFKIADQIEERHEKAKAHIDKLTQSILAKAFRGELVPQNANDEPAPALIERIHASKNRDLSNRKPFHSRKARIKR